MGYIRETNTIVLEIAKSGSRSLVQAATSRWGELAARGHHNIATSIERARAENPAVIAVIRNPADRYVSAFNFHFSRKDHTLDSAMDLVKKNGVHYIPVFNTQRSFLFSDNKPHTLKLFPMERIGDAFKAIDAEPEHKNKRAYAWPREEIEAHPLFDWIMSHYEGDHELWQKLQSESAQDKASAQPTHQPQLPEPGRPTRSTRRAAGSKQRRKSQAQTSRSRSRKTSGKTDAPESAGSN